MTAFIALVRTDLRLYFSNRRALVMSILAPIAIAAFFGAIFNPHAAKPSRIPVAVSDLDGSPLTKAIVASLSADAALAVRPMPEAAAASAVRTGEVKVAVVLPAGFGATAPRALFGMGDKADVTLRHDPSQSMALAVVRGLLSQYVMQSVAQSTFGTGLADAPKLLVDLKARVAASGAMPEGERHHLDAMFDSILRVQQDNAARPASGAASAGGGARFELPFATREVEVTSGDGVPYDGYAHSFAGMGVQFILFSGIELGIGMLLARRLGLWKRLRAAPVSRGLLIGSRVASGALTALVLLAVIYAAAISFFGVRIAGSVPGFIGIAIAFSLLTASFGLLVAALGRTPEATRGLAIFATLILVMLGGAWVPSFVFPAWLQTVSLAVPTRWAVDGLDAMTWRGLGLEAAWPPIVVMLGFSALFFAVALWRFEWEETPA